MSFNNTTVVLYEVSQFPVSAPAPAPIPFEDELKRIMSFTKVLSQFTKEDYVKYVLSVLNISGVLYTVVTGFGTVSNIINILVFYRQGPQSDSCTCTLIFIAISDFLMCMPEMLLCVLTNIIASLDRIKTGRFIVNYEGHNIYADSQLRLLMLPLRDILGALNEVPFEFTSWMVVYLTLERMLSVTIPFRVKDTFTPRRSCLVSLFVVMCAICFQIVRYLCFQFEWLRIPGRNKTVLIFKWSNFLPYEVYNKLGIFKFTYNRGATFMLVFIFNAVVILKVISSKKFRKTNASSTSSKQEITAKGKLTSVTTAISTRPKSNKELRLIRMIIMVSVVFLICRIPHFTYILIYNILALMTSYHLYTASQRVTYFGLALNRIGNFLLLMNAAANIFIYFALSQKYRRTLREMFSRCHPKK